MQKHKCNLRRVDSGVASIRRTLSPGTAAKKCFNMDMESFDLFPGLEFDCLGADGSGTVKN